MPSPATTEPIARVTLAFGLGNAQDAQPLGGTATPKWAVTTDRGKFVIRVRPAEFASPERTHFAHTVLNRLAAAGQPVPHALARADATTTCVLGGLTFEVLSWIEGEPWPAGNPDAAKNLGAFLAHFHRLTADLVDQDAKPMPREDDPAALQDCLARLRGLPATPEQSDQLAAIGRLLQRGRLELEATLYPGLPRAVIHGDFHPGNVRFHDAEVAALYDFDYLAVQARVRDLVDALMFFASVRTSPFEPDSIRSLTQPFVPDAGLAHPLLAGYQSVLPLTTDEWRALPLLLRSRWIQMRLRGSRKVPPGQQLDFALDGFGPVIAWLDHEGPGFFAQLCLAKR
jgi:homoserine kinase type II